MGAGERGRAQMPEQLLPECPFPEYPERGAWAGMVTCCSLSTGEKTKKGCPIRKTTGQRPSLLPALPLSSLLSLFLYVNVGMPQTQHMSPNLALCQRAGASGLNPSPQDANRPGGTPPAVGALTCTKPSATALGAGDPIPSVYPTHDPSRSPSTSWEWVDLCRTLQTLLILLFKARARAYTCPKLLSSHRESQFSLSALTAGPPGWLVGTTGQKGAGIPSPAPSKLNLHLYTLAKKPAGLTMNPFL